MVDWGLAGKLKELFPGGFSLGFLMPYVEDFNACYLAISVLKKKEKKRENMLGLFWGFWASVCLNRGCVVVGGDVCIFGSSCLWVIMSEWVGACTCEWYRRTSVHSCWEKECSLFLFPVLVVWATYFNLGICYCAITVALECLQILGIFGGYGVPNADGCGGNLPIQSKILMNMIYIWNRRVFVKR